MKMNMKKIISWGMMLAAAFTLTNCAKEIEDPNQQPEKQGYPFEIVASTVDTKTVNEGMATKWDDDDAINLFHAEAGAEVYGANDKFTIADVEACRFTGELTAALETTKSYDWYALYPYNSNIATPGDRAEGYTYIGHSKGLNQTGYDNMASLKETICPLYGVAKAVASSDTPSITMNHLTSVVAIKVTNTTEEPLTITTASLTAEEDIVGSYFIDITKSPVVYKASEGFVKNTAVVNVSDGTALAKGESATLYLAIKPFTAKAGTSLTLSVNDYAKEPKVLTSDVTFHAGKIKTLNFSYDKVEAPAEPEECMTATLTFDDAAKRIVSTTTQQVWVENDITLTYNKADYNNNLAEYEKPVRFYANTTISLEAPGNIESIDFACNTTAYATALKNAISGSSVNDKIVTVTLDGSSSTVTYKMTAQVRMDALTVKYAKVDPSAPSITAGNVIDVSARGVEAAELTYEIANLEYSDLTVTCDGTVVTSASKGEDGVINYVVSVNTTTSARDGSITISNGTVNKEVKVSQLAPVFTVSRDAVELGATADSQTTVTVTSDFDWELSMGGSGYTATPASYTWSEGGKQTVTIKATSDRTEEGVAALGTITLVNATGQTLTIKVTQETSYVNQESETVTMSIFANKGTVSGKSISWTQSGFTVTNNQASSSNAIRTSDSDHFRVYAKSELVFSASNKTFEKVVVTCTSSSYATALQTSAKNAGLTASVSGSVVTISTSAPTSKMPTITISAQTRINQVEVELN